MSTAHVRSPADNLLAILMARHENDNDEPEVCQHHDVSLSKRTGWCERLTCNDCGAELPYDEDA